MVENLGWGEEDLLRPYNYFKSTFQERILTKLTDFIFCTLGGSNKKPSDLPKVIWPFEGED